MDQLATGRRGGSSQIAHFAEQNGEPPPGRIARDTGAVYAAADDENVIALVGHDYFFSPSRFTRGKWMRLYAVSSA